ncbi:MAG: VWA domain-containing protein [Acidobacteria bacterium]|nr:VWA domain-containing protein [Acidobacteriota bacterium]
MRFLEPGWLMLFIPLFVAGYAWRKRSPWRVLPVCALLVWALAKPQWLASRSQGTLIVMADRSASMASQSRVDEIIELIRKHQPRDKDLEVLGFADGVVRENSASPSIIGVHASRADLAVERAGALIADGQAARALLISDGEFDRDQTKSAALQLSNMGITIDGHWLGRDQRDPLYVEDVQAPSKATASETIAVVATFVTDREAKVHYHFRKMGSVIAEGELLAQSGENRVLLKDRLGAGGQVTYEFKVWGIEGDPIEANNQAVFHVLIEGEPQWLHLASESPSSLLDLLRKSGRNVVSMVPLRNQIDLSTLSRFDAVILENVTALTLGNQTLEVLAAWVKESGGGLMLTGGGHAFGAGGYFKSPLEPILPVTMEVRAEQRKLSVSLVICLDRSGSMMREVSGTSMMDLANRAAVESMKVLGENDYIAVYAVDTRAHEIVSLRKVNPSIRNNILSIQSSGGGIYIEDALRAGYGALIEADTSVRHLFLFADASDSENPGAYVQLVDMALAAGITTSVVGLGTPTDIHAGLLREIAQLGGGECFFTEDALELPQIFVQDTINMSRSAFVQEPTGMVFMPAMSMLGSGPWRDQPIVDAYNVCYLQTGADVAAVNTEEEPAPLVAFWQVGSGRVICYMGDASGSKSLSDWPKVGSFFNGLASYAERKVGTNHTVSQSHVVSGSWQLKLFVDANHVEVPQLKVLTALPGQKPQSRNIALTWPEREALVAKVDLAGDAQLLPVLEWPDGTVETLPMARHLYSPEYRPSQGGKERLQWLAQATGGHLRNDFKAIWDEIEPVPSWVSMAPFVVASAMIWLLASVLVRLMGAQAMKKVVAPTPSASKPINVEPQSEPGLEEALNKVRKHLNR